MRAAEVAAKSKRRNGRERFGAIHVLDRLVFWWFASSPSLGVKSHLQRLFCRCGRHTVGKKTPNQKQKQHCSKHLRRCRVSSGRAGVNIGRGDKKTWQFISENGREPTRLTLCLLCDDTQRRHQHFIFRLAIIYLVTRKRNRAN